MDTYRMGDEKYVIFFFWVLVRLLPEISERLKAPVRFFYFPLSVFSEYVTSRINRDRALCSSWVDLCFRIVT